MLRMYQFPGCVYFRASDSSLGLQIVLHGLRTCLCPVDLLSLCGLGSASGIYLLFMTCLGFADLPLFHGFALT